MPGGTPGQGAAPLQPAQDALILRQNPVAHREVADGHIGVRGEAGFSGLAPRLYPAAVKGGDAVRRRVFDFGKVELLHEIGGPAEAGQNCGVQQCPVPCKERNSAPRRWQVEIFRERAGGGIAA